MSSSFRSSVAPTVVLVVLTVPLVPSMLLPWSWLLPDVPPRWVAEVDRGRLAYNCCVWYALVRTCGDRRGSSVVVGDCFFLCVSVGRVSLLLEQCTYLCCRIVGNPREQYQAEDPDGPPGWRRVAIMVGRGGVASTVVVVVVLSNVHASQARHDDMTCKAGRRS